MMQEILNWLVGHPWSVWLSVALVLAACELLTTDLTLLMLAGGAAAGALIALVLPGSAVAQVLTAVVAAVLMLALLRPTLLKRVQSAPGYRSALDRMVGSVGTITQFTTGDEGEVRVNGELWTARSAARGLEIPIGAKVEVYEVEGTTLLVYPRDLPLGWQPDRLPD
jgi:membrane protein implicated in regulation of membrane protease activity